MATFFFFFFFFFEPGLKLDEKSIENGLEGQKFLVVCLFWGGCHHPNGCLCLSCLDSYNVVIMNTLKKAQSKFHSVTFIGTFTTFEMIMTDITCRN